MTQLQAQNVPFSCGKDTGTLRVSNLENVSLEINLDGGYFPNQPALMIEQNQNVTLRSKGVNIQGIFLMVKNNTNIHIIDYQIYGTKTQQLLFDNRYLQIDQIYLSSKEDQKGFNVLVLIGNDFLIIRNATFDLMNGVTVYRPNDNQNSSLIIDRLTMNSLQDNYFEGSSLEIQEIRIQESQLKIKEFSSQFSQFTMKFTETVFINKIRVIQDFDHTLAYLFQISAHKILIKDIKLKNLKGKYQKEDSLQIRSLSFRLYPIDELIIEKMVQENNTNNLIQLYISNVKQFYLQYYSVSNFIFFADLQLYMFISASGMDLLTIDQIEVDFTSLSSLTYPFITLSQISSFTLNRGQFPSNPNRDLQAVKALTPLMGVSQCQQITITNSMFEMNGLALDVGQFLSNNIFQFNIHQSKFSHINTRAGNGGCLYFQDQNAQLSFQNVLFDSCISNYFAGGVYGGTLIEALNVTQQNCRSMVAGGSFFSQQSKVEIQQQITYVNNEAHFQANFLQLDDLKIQTIYEYNPQLIDTDLFLKETNYQNPKDQVQLRTGLSYVITFHLSNKTINSSQSAGQIQQPINLFQFSKPENTANINLIQDDIQNFKNQPYLIFFMNTQQAISFQNVIFITFIDYQYNITFNFKFKSECDEGMQPYQFFGQSLCKYCDFSTVSYSNLTECQVCNEYTTLCYANYSSIKQGNWRSTLTVNIGEVYPCSIQPQNCVGGNKTGNYLCKEGTIGPQCLNCDIKQSFWNESYGSTNNFGCLRCIDVQRNTAKIIISAILFLVISIFLIKNQYKSTLNIVYASYLSKMGVIYIGNSLVRTRSTTPLTKILLFGLSIYEITSFNSQFSVITNLSILFGYPVNSFISADCFLNSILPAGSSVGFGKLILSVLVPSVTFVVVVILLIFGYLQKKIKLQRLFDVLVMAFGYLFLFTYYQTIFSFSLQSLSCIKLEGNLSYLLIDLSNECSSNSSEIQTFKVFATVFLIVLSIVSPLAFFCYIFQTRTSHHRIQVKFKVGFVFQEYQSKYYYWEMFRQTIKILMVMIKIFFIKSVVSTIVLYSICLIIYLYFLVECRPFTYKQFNQLEITQIVLSLSHILASLMYKYMSDNSEDENNNNQMILQIIFYTIQVILLIFFAYLILLIITSFFVNTLTKLSRTQYVVFFWMKKYFPQYSHQLFKNMVILRKLSNRINLKISINNESSQLLQDFSSNEEVEINTENKFN